MADDPIWDEDNGEGLREQITSGTLTLQAAIDKYAENAAEYDKPNIIRALLDSGMDVNLDINGDSLLFIAAAEASVNAVKLLIERGADVNKKNEQGDTPLLVACNASFVGNDDQIANLVTVVHDLIEEGEANPNIVDILGNSPLMVACKTGLTAVAILLVDYDDVDVNLKNNEGNTALIIASEKGNVDIVRELVSAGVNADKTITNNAGKTAYDVATNEEIKALVSIPQQAPYSGKTKSDIDYLEVFLGKTDAVTSEESAMDAIKNMTVCPVCNAIDSRGPGCMYMYHVCKKENRHEELYQKYKGEDGMIWWCVYCGRICKGHRHYQLHLVDDTIRPGVFEAGSPFAFSCDNSDPRDMNGYVREVRLDDGTIRRDQIPPSVTNNGGNIREKLMRIARMVDYMFELQHFTGEISAKEARKELIEEMWNAPMFRMRFDPLKFKKWKTDLSVFKDDTAASATEVVPEAVPAPGDIEDPIIHDEPEVESSLLDEPPIIEFKHKNKDGVMFNHVHGDDDKRFIGKLSLVSFMKTMGEKLGKCFDDDCGGWLWPQEIAKAFDDPRLAVTDEDRAVLAAYKERFNSAKAPRVGGAEKWKFNHFTEMDDAMCYLPPKGKKAGNKTRKNKIKRAKKTRRN